MSVQNPTNAQYYALSLGESIRSPPSHPGKSIAKITTAFIGALVVSATILVALSGTTPSSNTAEPSHEVLATQEEPIQLENDSQNRYVEFRYDPISGKYSHVNKDGSIIHPFVVKNVERHSEKIYDAYLHKKDKNEEGSIYWKFNLKSTEKILEKLEIRMVSINNIVDGGGKAEACLQPSEICKDIPVGGVLTLEKPESETLTVGIKLFKDIQLFGRDAKCTECGEFERGFSVKAFWTPRHPAEISTTPIVGTEPPFELIPTSGENSAKFTYNVINNSYSHKHPDGSLIKLFNSVDMERVEDKTANTVFLRRSIPTKPGSIGWALNLKIDGKTVEKVVIKMKGIEEVKAGGRACACINSPINPKCVNVPINGAVTLENQTIEVLYWDIKLDQDIQIFKTKLNDQSSVESISVQVYWKSN